MLPVSKGRYRARLAANPADLEAALRLRAAVFRPAGGGDGDGFDSRCRHVLIEAAETGELAACFRLLPVPDGGSAGESYSAQFYDLTPLSRVPAPMAELGRFCVAPGLRDPDVLRTAWAAIARMVDREGIAMVFGCASFSGIAPTRYHDAFALLAARHLGPDDRRPGIRAPETVPLGCGSAVTSRDPRRAAALLPPLLRSYLALGGWVSDHAVVDRELGTLHVFTALEIARIPPARARVLRAVAG